MGMQALHQTDFGKKLLRTALALCLALFAFGVENSATAQTPQVRIAFADSTKGKLSNQDKRLIRTIAAETYAEVRALLPALPSSATVEIRAGKQVIESTGEVGAALAPTRVAWTVDPDREESVAEIARKHLRTTLFHEFHHLVRGWTMDQDMAKVSMIDAAIAEGMATAFARDFAGAVAPWAEFPDDIEAWADELKALPADALYDHWMFSHPDGRQWIGYRAGTYLVDKASEASGMDSIALAGIPTSEIVELSEMR